MRIPYNPWLIELPRIIIPLTFINLITYLLHYKIKRNILFITAFILILKITQLSYLTYTQASEELFRTVSINKIKITSLVLKIIFLLFNLSYYIFIYRKINASLSNENIYHLQLKKWATTFILVLIYCITYNILLFFLTSIFFDIQVILISLIICLTISFRPNYFNKTDFKLTINNTFNKVKQDDLSIEKFKSEFFLKLFHKKELFFRRV